MKIQITTIAVALATSLISYAEPPEGKGKGGPEGKKGPRPLPQEIVEKFDTDGDGKLNKEERKAAFEARKAEMLQKYDKDGDGKLSEDERKAAAADRKSAAIKRFDKDGDGQLSDEEKKAMREEIRKRRGGPEGRSGKSKGGKKGPKKPAGE
ncbi:MAG: EF-hand domain-containing protein [Akkermansiaceae bacterium]